VQGAHKHRIDLDGDDATGASRELLGESAAPGADLDHEITGADLGIADELGCKLRCAEEVLATRRRLPRAASASAGHGSGS
jgi:hypothetical protein